MKKVFALMMLTLFITACVNNPEQAAAEAPEVYSLLGVEYFAPKEVNAKLDSNLVVARKNFKADPSEENFIWLGRRTAYLTATTKPSAGTMRALKNFRIHTGCIAIVGIATFLKENLMRPLPT